MEEKPGKIEEKEYITKAAIRFPDGEIFTGVEHEKILEEFSEKISYKRNAWEREEGFVTNNGRFVSRQEAAQIAFKAGQIPELKDKLFSPDLNKE